MSYNDSFFQSVADGSWKTYRQGWFDGAKQKAQAAYAGAKIAASQKLGRVENCANYDAQITSLESQIATLNSQLTQFNATLEQLKSAKQTCDATRGQMDELQRQAAEIQAKMNSLKSGAAPVAPAQ
jgi:uncharacterized protein YPO0396